MNKCTECGSYAINHHCHGRDGSDPELCDVCYWRVRATDYAALEAECRILRNSLAGSKNQARANKLEAEKFAIDWLKVLEERDALRQQRDSDLAYLLDEVTDKFAINYIDDELIGRIKAALSELTT